jgi:hypothetical protein
MNGKRRQIKSRKAAQVANSILSAKQLLKQINQQTKTGGANHDNQRTHRRINTGL